MVFTWQVGRHPKSGVAVGEGYRRIQAIDVVDDHYFYVACRWSTVRSAPRTPCMLPTRRSMALRARPRRRPAGTRPAGTRGTDSLRRNAAGAPLLVLELASTTGHRTREIVA